VTRIAARLFFFVFALLLVGCDHATKHWAVSALRGSPPVELVSGALHLRYAENTDVAFSLLRRVPEAVRYPVIVAFGLTATVAVVVIWLARRQATRIEQLAFALLIGGAVGNLADRLLRGHVVDFIHLRHWPVFNVADVAIVAGGALLAWAAWRHRARAPAPGA
jgi:signal peptidase II